jgi:ribosomal protein S18 acetylase RimI-like enzyme
MSSPLRPLSMSEIDDEGAAVVANRLVEEGVRIDALIGSVATAQRMARRLGVETKERFRLGNHMLDQAPVIPFCAGAMRAATMDDLEPVLAWEDAFVRECGLPYDHAAIETAIRERLGAPAPLEWLWEVDGVPVAKALGRPSNAVARISQVYTAPEQRGHGYAGALVGNLSLALQEQGCEMLFLATDMANPTSNGVYRRLGYRFVGEATHLDIVRRS